MCVDADWDAEAELWADEAEELAESYVSMLWADDWLSREDMIYDQEASSNTRPEGA